MDDHTLELDCSGPLEPVAPYELVRRMRASFLVLGALVGRLRRAEVSLPGGCVIGPRLECLRGLGVGIEVRHGNIAAWAPELKGGTVRASGPLGSSVGATINALLASVLAPGETVIAGAAREPEVEDTARFLKAMGAGIEGAGTGEIRVRGVLSLCGAEHRVIPDRIEAGTYLLAGALCRGEVLLERVEIAHLGALLEVLKLAGADFELLPGALRVRGGPVRAVERIVTAPYPGFPTDMQAQLLVLLSAAPGESRVEEGIFPDRFMHVPELNRLGAEISVTGATARVRGGRPFSGAPVMASDLRASAALVLAGLCARGRTVIRRVYHLDRGYERMDEKLNALGARIRRLPD